jgi:hypothetical protein
LLRIFGVHCFSCLRPYQEDKLSAKSVSCVFIGYSPDHKGYRCLDQITGRVHISRHVVFDEKCFPFSSAESPRPIHPLSQLPVSTHSPSPPNLSELDNMISSSNLEHQQPTEPSQPSSDAPYVSTKHPMVTRSQDGTREKVPLSLFSTRHPIPSALIAAQSLVAEPKTLKSALRYPKWVSTVQAEHKALLRNQTWSLVPRHQSMKVIDCK